MNVLADGGIMHRDHEVWRVKGRKGGVIICTIHERGDAVVIVRTTMADGTLLRIQQTADIATARIIAAQWLDAIRDFVLDEGVSSH
jgi:hypothetical protein